MWQLTHVADVWLARRQVKSRHTDAALVQGGQDVMEAAGHAATILCAARIVKKACPGQALALHHRS